MWTLESSSLYLQKNLMKFWLRIVWQPCKLRIDFFFLLHCILKSIYSVSIHLELILLLFYNFWYSSPVYMSCWIYTKVLLCFVTILPWLPQRGAEILLVDQRGLSSTLAHRTMALRVSTWLSRWAPLRTAAIGVSRSGAGSLLPRTLKRLRGSGEGALRGSTKCCDGAYSEVLWKPSSGAFGVRTL